MKIISLLFALAFILINPFTLLAQHEHHQMPMQKKDTAKAVTNPAAKKSTPKQPGMQMDDTMKMGRHDHEMKMGEHAMMDTMPLMTHSYSLNLPMSRNSSGTAWQPDATPMYGYMKMTKKWNLMFHGSIFFRYNYQDITNKGVRSDSLTDRFDAPNWIMLMASRKVNKRGLFSFSLIAKRARCATLFILLEVNDILV